MLRCLRSSSHGHFRTCSFLCLNSFPSVSVRRHHRKGRLNPCCAEGTPLRAKGFVNSFTSSSSLERSALEVALSRSSMSDYSEELQRAIDAVRLACVLCETVQLKLKTKEWAEKGDASPVTIADYGAQALVAWSLQQGDEANAFSLVAEEDSKDLQGEAGAVMRARITELVNATLAQSGVSASPLSEGDVVSLIDAGGSPGGPKGRHWVLDPIDGTRGFVGLRQYAVCLGMLDGGQLALGVLGCPNLPQAPITDLDGESGAAKRVGEAGVGCLFTAVRGQGAFQQPLSLSFGRESAPQPLKVKDSSDFSQQRFMESYESGHSDFSFTAAVAKEVGITRPPLRLDSQAKYGVLARGDADIIMRFPHKGYREKIWDHAAGALIVTEAGARISDAGGNPLDFSKGRWLDLDRGIVTAPPKLHAAILKAIQTLPLQPV
eukprot:jgi/Botrbrau1/14627/Bobra.0364s0011.1